MPQSGFVNRTSYAGVPSSRIRSLSGPGVLSSETSPSTSAPGAPMQLTKERTRRIFRVRMVFSSVRRRHVGELEVGIGAARDLLAVDLPDLQGLTGAVVLVGTVGAAGPGAGAPRALAERPDVLAAGVARLGQLDGGLLGRDRRGAFGRGAAGGTPLGSADLVPRRGAADGEAGAERVAAAARPAARAGRRPAQRLRMRGEVGD